jgi:hypothetical protein
MKKIYDTIIWGASPAGLKKAIELKSRGRDVVLLNKFGFPGGNLTEALSCYVTPDGRSSDPFMEELVRRTEKLRFGVIYNRRDERVLHPEAVKRAAWDTITSHDIPVIFHLTPLRIEEDNEKTEITLFGREGTLTLNAGELLDLSDNCYLGHFKGEDLRYQGSIRINCFFKDMKPEMEKYFGFEKVLKTDVGAFAVFKQREVLWDDIEKRFNEVLDQLAVEGWKKFGVRMLIMPVYPELILEKRDQK